MKYDFEKTKKIKIIIKQIIKIIKEFQKFLDFVSVYLNIKKLKYDNNDETIFIHVFDNCF